MENFCNIIGLIGAVVVFVLGIEITKTFPQKKGTVIIGVIISLIIAIMAFFLTPIVLPFALIFFFIKLFLG